MTGVQTLLFRSNQIARLAGNHSDNLNYPVRMSNAIEYNTINCNAVKYMNASYGFFMCCGIVAPTDRRHALDLCRRLGRLRL